ncbi:hypothetical protein CR165_10610 [Pseudoroseomonas aestuarii]|uniref:Uncharacterized protein n=1 Tax=Teichococcus aestuarii TaxID=568898 RepID=A0A2U1V5A1_9PROT|nr:hypothetical protein CR165_10610 [Pseudoroseomonas aestuarii]
MRHLTRRPVVDALREAELTAVTGGLDGEFPVLCRVEVSAGPIGDTQANCVPLGRIAAFVFRTGDERDQVAGKMFENISTDGLSMEVAPALFSREGPSRFNAEPTDGAAGEAQDWIRADALAGAVGTVLSLAHRRLEAAAEAGAFLDGAGGLPVDLPAFVNSLLSPDGPWETPGTAVAAVTSSLRGLPGQDPLELVDLYAEALRACGYSSDNLDRFRNFVSDVITSRRARRPQDLADEGDLLLRALLLVLQRDRIDDILDDSADGMLPGPAVHLTAAALAGFREGLARMPSAIKQPFRDVLGEFASAVEANPSVRLEDLAAPLKARLPAAPATAPLTSTLQDGAILPSVAASGDLEPALVRELQLVAESLGLSQARPEEGMLGTCAQTRVAVLVSPLRDDAAQAPTLCLRVVIGNIAGGALVRAALSDALKAEPGSVLWLAPGSNELELVLPIGAATEQNLPRVLSHHVELARRWHAAAASTERPASGDAPAETAKALPKPRGGGGRKRLGPSSTGQGAGPPDADKALEAPQDGLRATGGGETKPAPRRRLRKGGAEEVEGEAAKPSPKRRLRKEGVGRDRPATKQVNFLGPVSDPVQGAEPEADAEKASADPPPEDGTA